MEKKFSAVVFDLGGVLIELGEFPIKSEWQKDPDGVKPDLAYWAKSEIGIAFERGELSSEEFAIKFTETANLSVSPDEFLAAFRRWPKGPYSGVKEFLVELRSSIPIALFSNVNAIHWDRICNEMRLTECFDYRFASHLIHRTKPEVAAFEYIAAQMNFPPSRLVFLDDNAANVAAASVAGFSSHQVRGFDETQAKLKEIGIIG